MKIIGLCGSSGAGKGYLCSLFARYGVGCIDTDRVYREICLASPACIKELTDYFGTDILTDGAVDKKKLAAVVFEGDNSEADLKALNRITHKYIKIETDRLVSEHEAKGYSGVLIDAPVLFESGFDAMCHATVCIVAPLEEKLNRIVKRDNISCEKALARLGSQLSDEELISRCTYAIDNSAGADLDSQIISVLKGLEIGTN